MDRSHYKNSYIRSIFYYIGIFLVGKPIMQVLTITLANFLQVSQQVVWLDIIYLFSFVVFIIALFILVKHIEKRTFSELSLTFDKQSYRTFIRYFIIGLLIIGISLWTLNILGIYQLTGIRKVNPVYLSLSLFAFFVQSTAEELLNRGYLHHRVQENKGFIWGLVVNSFFFTLPHLLTIEDIFNPQIIVITVNLLLISILFTLVMTVNYSLWASIGLHLGWNYSLGSIFGVAVSGLDASNGLLNFNVTSSNIILSGGTYGLEGSILLIPILGIIIIVYSYLLTKRKGKTHGLQ